MNKNAIILAICAPRVNFSLHESFDGVTAMPIRSEFLTHQAIASRILTLYREHNCFPRRLNSSITRFEMNNAVISDLPQTFSAINHSIALILLPYSQNYVELRYIRRSRSQWHDREEAEWFYRISPHQSNLSNHRPSEPQMNQSIYTFPQLLPPSFYSRKQWQPRKPRRRKS